MEEFEKQLNKLILKIKQAKNQLGREKEGEEESKPANFRDETSKKLAGKRKRRRRRK